MRVVAGEFGGRRLATPAKGADVRPTADRVREALFSILGEITGATVLDLFAGTGALAIEALSRGAGSATLVDTEARLARRNVDDLGLVDRATIKRADVLSFLRRERGTFDLVFCDPPYRLADRLGPELGKLLVPRLAKGSRVITESAVREPLELGLPIGFERTYGDTVLRIHDA
ncbi:MAG: RsmD family RNA methyltransferase [Solirubrobacterales bacterium]